MATFKSRLDIAQQVVLWKEDNGWKQRIQVILLWKGGER